MTVNIEGLGKITATKEVLNTIAYAFMQGGSFYRSIEFDECADEYFDINMAILEALNNAGYFD